MPLVGGHAQVGVSVAAAVARVEPLERVVVVAEPPVDRAVAQFVVVLACAALRTPLTVAAQRRPVGAHLLGDEHFYVLAL